MLCDTYHKQENISKKQRRMSECGSEGDWDFVLDSAHHLEVGDGLSSLLGLQAVSRKNKAPSDLLAEHQEQVTLDEAAPLLPYIPQILLKLHLLYEDMKLDRCHREHLPYLCGLTVRLAADLHLSEWTRHYWRDQPGVCPRRLEDARTGQMSPEQAKAILSGQLHLAQQQQHQAGAGSRRKSTASGASSGRGALEGIPKEPPCIYSFLKKVGNNKFQAERFEHNLQKNVFECRY